ncbi:TonB-dependent receptor [Subsaxibacter sp. CAU 1640]|uniref:SusC/RagA family TonB-linked outer membrane protein n=1 Tax=Subsaxibacter sp. CAU 1640 TaxID=2933271 RepID=UPI00200587B2|nr:TonB-dependent receptor [Subsaxibacter sp. CAU 1640]MCK7589075.1 TonB-dependent receptor [Subsaxibacter sp. CAU 1640]
MKVSLFKPSLIVLFLLLTFNNSVVFAQNTTVTGTVTAEDIGGPLPGVTVLVKGTSNGAVTDFDGNYTLNVTTSNAILVFSYVGYITQEVNIGTSKTINVDLKPSLESLDEVVVIGYGTTKKSDLTGSVVTIDGSALTKQPISNVGEALTGRLAGVSVVSTEGSPDAEINIRVRGGSSLTQDSSPLIIVDGFPISNLSDIAASDIENISVLKDASSTAIYGSRGANGVVIITTKSGKEGKISVNFNMFYGVKKVQNFIDVLEPEDYVKWQYEYSLLRNNPDLYEDYFGTWQDYDQYIGMEGNNWQKQIYGRLGKTQSRDLAIRGGSEKVNFNFNYAHYDEKAIMVGSNFKRDNLSLSLKAKPNDRVNLNFTMRYSDTEINGGGANEQNEVSSQDSRLKHAVGYSPIPVPGVTTTNTDEAIFGNLTNPFIAVDDNQRRQFRKNFNMLGSFSWEFLDDLTYKMDLGLDNRYDLDYRFYGRSTYYSSNRPEVENQGLPGLITRDRKRETFRNANTLNYDFKKILGENHSLKLLLGEEMIVTKDNRVTSELHGFPADFDFETSVNLTTQGDPFSIDNFNSPDDKLLSFFGRLEYDYKNRYLVTGTFRADGSSKFLGNNRWGYFPSAAVAWKISEENFLKDVSWINTLKLRASYGEVGNNNILTGQTRQTFQSYNTGYLNGINSYWATSDILANPNLKWETTTTQNFGFDFDLLRGRINGTIETYKNLTTDLLFLYPTPGTGYESQFRNAAELQNTGIEATLNVIAIENADYGLNFSFNINFNKQRINSLGGLNETIFYSDWASSQIPGDFILSEGGTLGMMYGYVNDGRYEISDFTYNSDTQSYILNEGVVRDEDVVGEPMPGNMKLKDLNGDGIIDVNDRTVIGNANPKHTGGIVLNAYAYGFDLSAAFNWSVGNDIYNANKIEFTTANANSTYRNLSSVMADGVRWTNLDPNSGQLVTDPDQLAALNANTTLWSPFMDRYVLSDWAIEDGSFLRLNTLTLGYTTPESITSKMGVSRLRFYLTANNVFVLTNYSGPDPEVSTRRRSPLTPGVDYSAYPRARQLVFGLNLSF